MFGQSSVTKSPVLICDPLQGVPIGDGDTFLALRHKPTRCKIRQTTADIGSPARGFSSQCMMRRRDQPCPIRQPQQNPRQTRVKACQRHFLDQLLTSPNRVATDASTIERKLGSASIRPANCAAGMISPFRSVSAIPSAA